MLNKDLLVALYKKAKGYESTEEVEEYTMDGEGFEVLVKKRVTKKYVPSDTAALKEYMSATGEDRAFADMTDAELAEAKAELLAALKLSD